MAEYLGAIIGAGGSILGAIVGGIAVFIGSRKIEDKRRRTERKDGYETANTIFLTVLEEMQFALERAKKWSGGSPSMGLLMTSYWEAVKNQKQTECLGLENIKLITRNYNLFNDCNFVIQYHPEMAIDKISSNYDEMKDNLCTLRANYPTWKTQNNL